MKYKTCDEIALAYIAERPVLIALNGQKEVPYITMINETAAECWNLLCAGADKDQLCTKLSEIYEIEDPTIIEEDIQRLLNSLYEKKYLHMEEK